MDPNTFEQALRNSDPQLSLRWGSTIRCWIVERSCQIEPGLRTTILRQARQAQRLLGNPAVPRQRRDMAMKSVEEGISAASGRRIVVWTNQLDNRVFNALWMGDLQRHGIDAIDQKQLANEAKQSEGFRKDLAETSREVDNVIHFAVNRQSAALPHGKANQIVANVFGKEYHKGQLYSLPTIVDPTAPKPKKNAKITVASR